MELEVTRLYLDTTVYKTPPSMKDTLHEIKGYKLFAAVGLGSKG